MITKLEVGKTYKHSDLMDYYLDKGLSRNILINKKEVGGFRLMSVKSRQLDLSHLFVWAAATISGVELYKLLIFEGEF